MATQDAEIGPFEKPLENAPSKLAEFRHRHDPYGLSTTPPSVGSYRTMTSAIDRAAASRALAKAVAYHQAGKAAMAKAWAQRLVAMLRDAIINVS
jgi:hypothetical protein